MDNLKKVFEDRIIKKIVCDINREFTNIEFGRDESLENVVISTIYRYQNELKRNKELGV